MILAPPISRQTSRKAYTVKAGLGWLGLPADKATVDIDEVNVQSISSRSAKKQGSIPSRKPTASSSRTARRHSRQPDLVEPPEVRSPDPGFPTGIGSTRSWCRSSAGQHRHPRRRMSDADPVAESSGGWGRGHPGRLRWVVAATINGGSRRPPLSDPRPDRSPLFGTRPPTRLFVLPASDDREFESYRGGRGGGPIARCRESRR